eukprot:Anaeramoba_ignava/a483033_39.p2 GENE.a483033_39~~a483033_39.p2  ORF type:complete len:165 (+),score=60.52 a483033_39:30-524(+)
MSKTIPIEIRTLLYRIAFHAQTSNLKTSPTEQITRVDPLEILKRWVNYHVSQKINNNITNFTTDFEDLNVISILLESLSGEDFSILINNDNLQTKEQIFNDLLKQINYTDFFCSIDDFLNGREELIIKFLAKLFIWNPGFDQKKTTSTTTTTTKIMMNRILITK